MEVAAAAAALGVVKPATMHTIAPTAEPGLPMASSKLGVLYVGVTVPPNETPSLVHVAEPLLRVKEVKPVTVILVAAVAVTPVNEMVTEVEEVEMTLAEKAMEAEVNAPPRACWQSKSAVRKKIGDFIGIQVIRISLYLRSSAISKWSQPHIVSYSAPASSMLHANHASAREGCAIAYTRGVCVLSTDSL